MTIKLNHTIVHSKDKRSAADYFSGLFGLPEPKPFGPFLGVEVDNEVTLDFMDVRHDAIRPQHYAFLVGEEEFDQIFGRISERGLKYWADPGQTREGPRAKLWLSSAWMGVTSARRYSMHWLSLSAAPGFILAYSRCPFSSPPPVG